ncbi:MAG TPA: N-acetylglucosamine-6-phosphate deacetylase [Bacillota bacterium]|nr:N-acetylglucosamine-6-phosphate deacetylase [Bacillota bacterium]
MITFTNGLVFIDGRWETGIDIRVEGGRIIGLEPSGKRSVSQALKDEGAKGIVDAKGSYIVPGFIDIHVHGSYGADVMDASIDSLSNISSFLAKHGTSSYLATTMTCSVGDIRKSILAVSQYIKEDNGRGAQILGVHMEGPFINPLVKGAHDEAHIRAPSVVTFNEIVGDKADIIRLVTIAPELEGAQGLAAYLRKINTTVSIGHTGADYETAKGAIEAGINHTCHFYNAMTPIRHRQPGLVGAALDNDDSTIELIADLVHIHPAALRLAYRIKGRDKCVLITDAMSAAGLSDGLYELGGLKVYVENGVARQADGTLAGSTLTQDRALQNMVKAGVPLESTITMLTRTPAKVIGVDGYKGQLKKGYDADIVLLDKDLNIKETYIKGLKQT